MKVILQFEPQQKKHETKIFKKTDLGLGLQ